MPGWTRAACGLRLLDDDVAGFRRGCAAQRLTSNLFCISQEELSAEMAHKISKVKADPLEEFCESNPDADECRVYED